MRDRRGLKAPATATLPAGLAVAAMAAFAYSILAIAGAGAETVYWGFLLLIAGLPVYVAMKRP